jgi:superoxide dismutase
MIPERLKYIEAFFSNIDWQSVEGRLKHTQRRQATGLG